MKKTVRRVALLLLAIVFLGSGTVLVRQMIQYQEGEETYAEAETLAGLPDFSQIPGTDLSDGSASGAASGSAAPKPVYIDPYADALAAMDFTALREVNSDVLGWILIPGTKISYPIVQGDDNSYYLNHTWKKWNSAVGAIFMEQHNSPDFSDFHTLIYGHRMNNGSMFAGLKYYKQKSYYTSHPVIYITDDYGTKSYEIFAAYEVSTQGDTYKLGQQSDQSKQAYIDYCLAQSLYETGIVPTVNDRILTLSTCTGNGHATRWVVQGRLKGAEPAAAPEKVAPADGEAPGEADAPADTLVSSNDPAVTPEADAPADSSAVIPEGDAGSGISGDASATADTPVDPAASTSGEAPAPEN